MDDRYKKFEDLVKKRAANFKAALAENPTVRVISHLDSDGIAAAAIMIKALTRENIRYSVSILPQLNESSLRELALEEYTVYVFTDLGSGQLKNIWKYLSGKKTFVLDHHSLNEDFDGEGIEHLNPHLCGIDGTKELSGSGIVFLFAKQISQKNEDMAHVAIIGAIGDVQEKQGFSYLNNHILSCAVKSGNIQVFRSLRFFGAETKPLYKLLCYSTDPLIPGVAGSESKAIQFLNNIGVSPKVGNKWRKLNNLTKEETEALISSIIIKRKNEENPEDVLGNVYRLVNEQEGPTRDAREFSTMLNACGRLDKASIGIGACVGDYRSKKEAVRVLNDYKREIMNALRWYEKNKASDKVIRERGYIVINAGDEVLGTIIGTLASILSHSEEIPDKTFILSMARKDDGTTKASIRLSGKNKEGVDLKKLVEDITAISGGESGGHSQAAGAVLPQEFEQSFLEAAKKILSKKVMEEVVVENK